MHGPACVVWVNLTPFSLKDEFMAWFEADMQKANANRDKVLSIAMGGTVIEQPHIIFH